MSYSREDSKKGLELESDWLSGVAGGDHERIP